MDKMRRAAMVAAHCMDLLTVARRASLGKNIQTYFANARTRLAIGASASHKITSSAALDDNERDFYQSTRIIGLVAAAEGLLSNLVTEYLVCYPARLSETTLSLDLLNETGSIVAAIEALAEKTVHEWSYDRFPEFARKAFALFDAKVSLDPALMDQIAEISATRDMYVHTNGIANRDYLTNAGALARTGLGRKLEVSQPYLEGARRALSDFVDRLEEAVPDKLKTAGKVSAFRGMWDATCMAKRVPFDLGWISENEEKVQPNEDGLAAAWLHNEQMLLEFFRGVYEHPHGRHFDVTSILWRFTPASPEAKVLMSWISSPFWF
jgi:hypothetical protein